MTKKQKILFSDLDATLLNDSKDIEPGTREAIDEMLAQGHIFTACTGRPLASALGVVKMFGLDKEGCYVAAYNGGVLYDPFRQKVIAYHSVPIPVVRRMFGEAQKAGLYIHTYDRTRDDAVMACRRTPELDAYTGHTKLVPVVAKDVLERLKDAPAKMIVISLTDHERLRQFEKEQAGWIKEILSYKDTALEEKLTAQMASLFVDKIFLYDGKRVEVVLNFKDEYESLYSCIEQVWETEEGRI